MTKQAGMQAVWPMYRALVGVGMLCGLLIALSYQGTLPTIERNRAAFLERAVFDVLPGTTRIASFTLIDGRFLPVSDAADDVVYAGFDAAGQLTGVAIEAAGMGYADTITLLYGYAPAQSAIVGLKILASKETPGLGDKIEKDPAFVANFVALDVRLDPSGSALANRVVTVKSGTKTVAWQIDGITGATISSQAIGDILAASSARWVPIVAARREDFTIHEADDET